MARRSQGGPENPPIDYYVAQRGLLPLAWSFYVIIYFFSMSNYVG
ncbi:hypothetical protein A4U88_3859 [Serratia marcescens]|nr:hypothetical protein A4U88_3859 [Serratia marcescens]